MAVFSIRTDPVNLIVQIQYEGDEDHLFRDVRFLLSSESGQLVVAGSTISLPWHEFQQALGGFGRIISDAGQTAVFDQLSERLIRHHLDDLNKSESPALRFSSDEISTSLTKNSFRRKLTPAQLRDLKALLSVKHGANFSVPGAGKTTTLLALYSVLKDKGIVNRLFVVAPLNAFISWEDEIGLSFSVPPVTRRLETDELVYRGRFTETAEILLVNYEKLRKNAQELFPFFLKNKVHLVLDESHRIKSGWNTQSYEQIIRLSALASRRDIMSGTPMPQHVEDLAPQFHFLWQKNLLQQTYNSDYNDSLIAANVSLKRKFTRTTKKELGLKPPKVSYVNLDMGSIQKELYMLFTSEAARQLAMDKEAKDYLRRMGRNVVRLLQIASNPMLLGSEDEYYDETISIPQGSRVWTLLSEFAKYEKPSKLAYLERRIPELLDGDKNLKIVLWTYFVRNILLLEKMFKKYNPVSIFGAIPIGNDEDERFREGRIRKFHNDPSCRLLIANPQAAGEGISLHKASHYAIYLDRNFNAAYYLQSVDRIHRLGLDPKIKTSIEILIAGNSIDEVLRSRIDKKTEAMGKVLNDKSLSALAYDPLDIPSGDALGLDMQDASEIETYLADKAAG